MAWDNSRRWDVGPLASQIVSRRFIVPTLVSIISLASIVGCSAPAPSAQFVQQAERLHAGALSAAVTQNPDLRDYVQLIGDRLAAAARQAAPNRANEELLAQLRCHLVDCPVINAFYTGGHHIYIYSALFAACRNEDELAAAIAHEYAHAIDLGVEKTRLRPEPNRSLAGDAWQFVLNRFSLDQQSAADDLAFLIYTRGGWDPTRFPQLFERLALATPNYVAPDRAPLATRAARFREQAMDAASRYRKPPVADPKTFESLRQQVASIQQQPSPRSPSMSGNAGDPATAAQVFLEAFPNCMLSGDPPETLAAQERLRPPPPPPTRLEPS